MSKIVNRAVCASREDDVKLKSIAYRFVKASSTTRRNGKDGIVNQTLAIRRWHAFKVVEELSVNVGGDIIGDDTRGGEANVSA